MNTDTHVEIKVNGKSVRQYNQDGNTYIEARAGTEYSIKINNNSWERKMAVITVDGVNVISGQPQSSDIGEGYIINARNSIDIKGFRKDSSSVGAFKSSILPSFIDPEIYRNSISDNCMRSIQCNYSTSSNDNAPNFDMGTTWGQKIEDSVITVNFEHEKQVAFPKAFEVFAQPPKGWKGK